MRRRLIAILRGLHPEESEAIGGVLVEAGIDRLEVPLNSPAPLASLERLVRACGADAEIGAGTVLTAEQVRAVAAAGARFVVAPNTDAAVVRAAGASGLASWPGAFTATECFAALAAGASGLKLFPAAVLGPAGVTALKAVLPAEVPVYAVGGVDGGDFAAYAAAGCDGFGVGSAVYAPGRELADLAVRARTLVAAHDAVFGSPGGERAMRRLVAIGECMLELRSCLSEHPTLGFGGDTLNTAVYAARMAHGGLDVAYATALGDDPFSARMMASWQAEGVATDLVRRLEGRLPGLYAIETDEAGERHFYYWRERAAARDLLNPEAEGEALLARLGDADMLYLSGISLAILDDRQRRRLLDALNRHREAGVTIAFDSNLRPALWRDLESARQVLTSALAAADIALVSLEDEQRLFDDDDAGACAARIERLGPTEVVVKQGASGALLRVDGAQMPVPPVPASQVADTTAAGDSFNGGYLALRLLGANPPDAAAAGAKLASHVVRHQGALIPKAAMPVGAAGTGREELQGPGRDGIRKRTVRGATAGFGPKQKSGRDAASTARDGERTWRRLEWVSGRDGKANVLATDLMPEMWSA